MHYTSKEVYEYISKKTSDPIIERKQCRVSGQDFPIYKSDLDFYDKISPKFEVSPDYVKDFLEEHNDISENFEYKDGKLKCKIPTPTLCPEERQRRRLAFRNERKLYKRQCNFVWDDIISIYSPDKNCKVYNHDIWWSDKRDALDYGQDCDFSKTFFEQAGQLMTEVPKLRNYATQNENSNYVNGVAYSKNCYLIFASDYDEDCFFIDNTFYSKDCLEISDGNNCSNSYELIWCKNISKSYYCVDCYDSDNLSYCFDCQSCKNCFLSTSLQNKQYYFKNKSYDKNVYEKLVKDYLEQTPIEERIEDFLLLKQWAVHNHLNQNNNSQSSGNFITNCNNSQNVFSCHSMQNCKNIINWDHWDMCHDSYVIIKNSQLCYQNVSSIGLYQCICTISCWNDNNNLYYCDHCQSCSHCFGCVWLRNKEYCIFNKQYTKEEYNQLVPKIIAQMMREGQRWEFFDPQLSPFWYNETVAMEYYPLTKEEALKLWYKRSDYEAPFPKVEKFVQGKKLWTASCKTIHEQKPELLEKLLNYAVVCEVSGRPFRIIKQEIDFYIKHDLPLPRKHPDIRHQERMDKRPWRTLYLRNCDKCGEEMLSVYPFWKQISPNPSLSRGELVSNTEGSISLDKGRGREGFDTTQQKIYCESCYQKEIYG